MQMANLAAIVAVVGAVVGGLLAAFSLGMSRSPMWAERRQFALVAATGAGYCAFDVAIVLDLPPATIALCVQVALAFGVVHCFAWLCYLAAADRRPLRTTEQWMFQVGLVIAVAALVPGLLVTRELTTYTVEWLGITYRTPLPTVAGLVAYTYIVGTLLLIAAGARHRWHEGWYARLPIVGVVTMGLLIVNDTLSNLEIIDTPLLLDSGGIVVVFAVGLMHEWRFAADVHQLERASTDLKCEVEARTTELLDAQVALEISERLAALGRLTAGVAHEVNNPISVVQHNLEQLRALGDRGVEMSAGATRYVEGALAATYRIVRVVRQLLDAGRAAAPEQAQVKPFLVAPVVRHALRAAERLLTLVHVTVEVDDRLAALGDPALAAQVLENLLTNAAHALEGRAGQDIHIRADRVDDRVRLFVADNGGGIADTIRGRLFEPFVTTKVTGKGTGLGLAVSQGLMRSQNGGLTLVRTSDAGTEMSIDFPWAPEGLPPEPPAAPEDATGNPALSLLIIDDDAGVREMLLDFTQVHFNAAAAGSVNEALAMLDQGRAVDVVLCDLMMPDGGAETWLTHCRTRYPRVADRTIIITGGPTTPKGAALVATCADRVLYKPFTVAQLNQMLARLVRR